MSVKNLFLLLTALLFAAPAFAAPEDKLINFFDHLQSLQADFTQQVFAPGGKLQQTTKGQVTIQRPGKFRWDYSVPYEQHIVADGSKIWLYDVDLEQVTIKPQDSTMANTPASLLSGSGRLQDQFDVLAVMREGKDWFELVPKKSDSGFEALYLMLDKDMIRVMELKDSFGQFTRISFENEAINKTYPASTFHLDIPKGVDVIDETAR